MFEPTENEDSNSVEMRRCTILIESDVVMVSRKIPAELGIGFIEWNRFCDRLDKSLEPLRSLAEEKTKNDPGRFKEQAAKTTALQLLQEACDKLCNHYQFLQLNLYCPFHSDFVSNWHIQVAYAVDQTCKDQTPSSTSTLSTYDTTIAHGSDGSQDVEDEAANSVPEIRPSEDTRIPQEGNNGEDNVEEDLGRLSSPATPTGINSGSRASASFRNNVGLGVLGVDYVEHVVQPTDTLKGICLQYNVCAFRLRQANLFSGENESLLIVPHKILAIPISEGFYSRMQETETQNYKLNAMRKRVPKLSEKEATAYLELADWVLEDALSSAREDIEWEKETKDDFF